MILPPLCQQGYIWFYVFAPTFLRSNWLCVFIAIILGPIDFVIFVPIVLGPIECVYASIVSAWVRLIALAKIECTWFVWIWVCGVVACLIVVMLMHNCWVAEYFDVIMLSETQCATSISVWTWMHVCLKVFVC